MPPDEGCNSPQILLSNVVLPFPFSPTKPIISPDLISKLIGPNAKLELYFFQVFQLR